MRIRSLAAASLCSVLLGACAAQPASRADDAHSAPSVSASPAAAPADPLFDTIAALDTALFDAFNHCDDAAQLHKHAAFFDPGVEFYHDKGGVSWTRDKMIGDVRANVCGKFARELVPGSLRVYPVPDFGAIELGTHRFCPFGSAACSGAGEFLILWHRDGEDWRVTRVFSYAHRAL
jgi:hypothetical protein